MVPIMTNHHGYCYFDTQSAQLHSFDGDALASPNQEELAWIQSRI
jgi:hypothetical protein